MCSMLADATELDVNTFQSNGLCRNTCNADYAFAILQGKSCWCSNYAPGETTNISECSDGCPGYPADNCGSVSKNLYAYIEMTDHAPSGTAKASNTATKTVSDPRFFKYFCASLLSSRSFHLSVFSMVSQVTSASADRLFCEPGLNNPTGELY